MVGGGNRPIRGLRSHVEVGNNQEKREQGCHSVSRGWPWVVGVTWCPPGQSAQGIQKSLEVTMPDDPFPKNPGCKLSKVNIIQREQGSLEEWLGLSRGNGMS